MRVVHIAGKQKPRRKRLTKLQEQRAYAREWMAKQDERNFQKALVEHADLIKSVQKLDPTWKPSKVKRAGN